MNIIQPPQLIEILVSQELKFKEISEIEINVRMFNELARKMLSINCEFGFSYFELLDFSSSFNMNHLIIDEPELHLHIQISEELMNQLSWYNKMYSTLDNPIEIYKKWKELGK